MIRVVCQVKADRGTAVVSNIGSRDVDNIISSSNVFGSGLSECFKGISYMIS